jgi:DNA polymerase elongation subunit (family B)
MQYNISPETFVGRSNSWFNIETLLSVNFDLKKEDPNLHYSHAANGCAYRKDKQGFLPALMEKMYNDRVEYKKKMIEVKKEYEKTKNKELEKDIARYHNLQLAKKIQLNSAYGALGNKYFRWFNYNHAEAITMSGQLSIRWIENKINIYLNNILKTNDTDYVVASDTDSIYVNMEPLVKHLGVEDELLIVKALDTFCESKIQKYINKCYEELSVIMNVYQQKMYMKRETIANKGIWKAKKMYILNAWNVEGVQYDKPKLKIQGIEAVRSSTPQACRENIKKALDIIMNEDEDSLKKFIKKFREEYMTLPFEQIAFPRGVNGVEKYYDKYEIYKKGTPIHVKGALLFNYNLVKYNINHIPPIMDGDKVKFVYLVLPNPIHDIVIATTDYLPKEFNIEKYIDRNKQFEKSFLEPLKSITGVIGWESENKSRLF